MFILSHNRYIIEERIIELKTTPKAKRLHCTLLFIFEILKGEKKDEEKVRFGKNRKRRIRSHALC